MLISDDKALQRLRDTAGYEVARALLQPKKRRSTEETIFNAAARTAVGVNRGVLSNTIEQLIEVSSSESDRIISRLIKAGKLLEMPKASFETESTVVLSNYSNSN
jgi:hypothetical protein